MEKSYRSTLAMFELMGSSYTLANFMIARSCMHTSSYTLGGELDQMLIGERRAYLPLEYKL